MYAYEHVKLSLSLETIKKLFYAYFEDFNVKRLKHKASIDVFLSLAKILFFNILSLSNTLIL